ncbi:MAG: hypothetical protein HRU06_21355 [Oceanospirillaceae bacterium]|nr:7TM-DISM domain-containing protein [Colwellia sp.]NQZ33825.1 hypothetical protein [Oceanospirillaceae bacterium]
MNCTECGMELTESDCEKCGKSQVSKNIAPENGSVDMPASQVLANNQLHVSNVWQGENTTAAANIERTLVKSIRLGERPVKTLWLIIFGLIGFVGSWATVFSGFGDSWKFLFLTIILLSMCMFLIGIILWRANFLRLKWFNLESNSDGEIFVTKMSGSCPNCEGSLKLSKLRVAPNFSKTFVRCSKNGDHIWDFDYKVLD